MSILITGGTGFIGLGLARRLLEKGEEVVLFDIAPQRERLGDVRDNVKIVQGDFSILPEITNAVKDNKVRGIFHLGAMLSQTAESNPWACFQTNVVGTMNVYEAARLFDVSRVLFSSAVGTFGLGRTSSTITDDTIQRPITAYGISKLYGELLGRFYRRKFSLDFRAVRFPSVIGPGVKSPALAQYNPWMIEHAVLGKPYECYVGEETSIPIIYFKDAIRALEMLYSAPADQIKTICYNASGITPTNTASELERTIKKFIPDAVITYKPDPVAIEFAKSLNIKVIDDSRAREDWGWHPRYAELEKVVADFIKEVKTVR